MHGSEREPVWRFEAGLRRDESPSADTGVNPRRLDGSKQGEQREEANGSSFTDGSNLLRDCEASALSRKCKSWRKAPGHESGRNHLPCNLRTPPESSRTWIRMT